MGKMTIFGSNLGERKPNPKSKFWYLEQQIPRKLMIKGLSTVQNYILFDCLVPRTIAELAENMNVHENTVRTHVKYLLDKDLLKVYDWKDVRKVLYVRNTMSPDDPVKGTTVELNAPMFYYGEMSATLIDYISALSDENTKIANSSYRIAGLLAHVWMRSFNARMGYHKRNIPPSIEDTMAAFNEEIERVEQFLKLLIQFKNSAIWIQEKPSKNSIPLLDTDPTFIRLFSKLQQEWVEQYNIEKDNEDDS
jgi:predicted DNA-binding transcriptional regulator